MSKFSFNGQDGHFVDRQLARLRGFRFAPSSPIPTVMAKGGTDLLRRKFPASGFDGTHAPLNAMSLVTPLTQITTSLSNTGFFLLSKLLEKSPEHRIVAADAKGDRWFASRPSPEALNVTDIMPLLQLAKIEDVATQNVPQFAPTGFSGASLSQSNVLAPTEGNTQNPSLVNQSQGDVSAALAVARARAHALNRQRHL